MRIILLFTFLLSFSGCNEKGDSDKASPQKRDVVVEATNTPTPTNTATPVPSELPEYKETIRVCNFNSGIDACEIASTPKRKLINLSKSIDGKLPEAVLSIEVIKSKYNLNAEQINCLKEKYCKEI